MEGTALHLDTSLFQESHQELLIEADISDQDQMWADNPSYLESASSALRCIRLALLTVGMNEPGRILDMGCGHGRVQRAIRAAYPRSEIAACDIDPDAVDFCVEHFGAIPVYSASDLSSIDLPGRFDLVWSGSLLTHIGDWLAFFQTVSDAMNAGGVMVVTTHGRDTVSKLRTRDRTYAMSEATIQEVLDDFDRTGFAFADGADPSSGIVADYGFTFASCAWTCRFVERFPLRVVGYFERGWHNHHDVLVCQKI